MKSSKIIYLILLLFFNSMLNAQDLSVLRALDAELTAPRWKKCGRKLTPILRNS